MMLIKKKSAEKEAIKRNWIVKIGEFIYKSIHIATVNNKNNLNLAVASDVRIIEKDKI